MTHAERLRDGRNPQTKVALVTWQLDLDVVFAQERKLVGSATCPSVEDIASPHEATTALARHNRRRRLVGFGAHNIRRVLGVDFKSMSHAYGQAANHKSLRVLSHAKVKFV